MSEPFEDLFEFAATRATPPTVELVSDVVGITVRKPKRNEFFRVHPTLTLDATILEHEGDNGRETYWVPPSLRSVVGDDAKPVRLFVVANRDGVTFLWPARLPDANSALGSSWHNSALLIAEKATESWVKMSGNRNSGRYDLTYAAGDLGEPIFSDKSIEELLKLGFDSDHIITSADHPVLRIIRGEI